MYAQQLLHICSTSACSLSNISPSFNGALNVSGTEPGKMVLVCVAKTCNFLYLTQEIIGNNDTYSIA